MFSFFPTFFSVEQIIHGLLDEIFFIKWSGILFKVRHFCSEIGKCSWNCEMWFSAITAFALLKWCKWCQENCARSLIDTIYSETFSPKKVIQKNLTLS